MLKNVNRLIMSHYIYAIANSKQHKIMVIPVHKSSFLLKKPGMTMKSPHLPQGKVPQKGETRVSRMVVQ